MKTSEKKYKYTIVAVDVVIFSVEDGELKVLLMKMKKKPYQGCWAAPGGLIKDNESANDAARRHLLMKTGLKNIYLEQLYTFSEVGRDPFGRVVSVAYFALIPGAEIRLKTSKEYEDIKWFNVSKLPKLAYDHKKMISFALMRLRAKIGYTNIVCGLLPREFAMSDLQNIYELIFGKKLDKRNFRKKVFALDLVRPVKAKRRGAHRPAALYEFSRRNPYIVEIL